MVVWLSDGLRLAVRLRHDRPLAVVFSGLWFSLYRDPQNHPRLSPEEFAFIEDGQDEVVDGKAGAQEDLRSQKASSA